MNIRIFAPTQNELFEEWKKNRTDLEERWVEYKLKLWHELLDFYFAQNWKLVLLGWLSKTPQYMNWGEKALSKEYLLEELERNRKTPNVGVVLKPSGLAEIDWDNKALPSILQKWLLLTYSICSPRGFKLLFTQDTTKFNTKELNRKLETTKYGLKGSILRGGILQAVLPLSIVQYRLSKIEQQIYVRKYHKKPRNEPPKIYTWIARDKLANLSEFIEDVKNECVTKRNQSITGTE